LTSGSGQRLVALGFGLSLLLSAALHLVVAARMRRTQAELQASEARLKLLQGQIEPHFLFNTLAGVVAQIDEDPPRARATLQTFTDYLRSALTALRQDTAPLSQELALVRQFLMLMQSRLEDRLTFEVQADADCLALPVPPLLLQPLVENAVRHGIEPSLDGGQVTVRVQRHGNEVMLEVSDTGVGLPPQDDDPTLRGPVGLNAPPASASQGNGLATVNLRERLATRYGPSASLTLGPRTDGHTGTVARVVLPMTAPAAAPAPTSDAVDGSAPAHPD
jgi:LytS/YehU family sensor histidine kinase